MVKRILCLFAALLLAALLPCPNAAADGAVQPFAKKLTGGCTFSSDFTEDFTPVTDYNFRSSLVVPAGRSVTLAWPEEVPAAAVLLSFYTEPAPFTVRRYDGVGALLDESAGAALMNCLVEAAPPVRSVTFTATERDMVIYALDVYGAGRVRYSFDWQPTPEKTDYLLIAAHPDDDVRYLGAIIPICSLQQGRIGTAIYMTASRRPRFDEAQEGAWAMGLRTLPLLAGFEDAAKRDEARAFSLEMLTDYFVRALRRCRPEVVVTHDIGGEGGNWHNKRVAEALLAAVPLAADETADPASAAQHGTWAVKKVYLHLYGENALTLPIDEPLPRAGGRTAREIAHEAFACHQVVHPEKQNPIGENMRFPLSDFGLAYTAVGPDTPGVNDLFEHIDGSVLHDAYATPTPAPTPSPTPTPAPTPTPMPAPTESPAAADTPAPTESPSKARSADWPRTPALLAAGGAAAVAAAVWIGRRRERKKRG